MKFRKILSVALSATLIASSVSLSVFAKETEDKKYDYVALGDSIAAGVGLENSDGTILTDRAVCVTPELLADPIKEAYATVFGKYLEEMGQANGCTTTATNLSAVGYRANDVAETILRDGFVGQTAVAILEGFLGPGGSAPLWQYHQIFSEYLSEAELVSIQLGGNDIILELFGDMSSQDNQILSILSSTMLMVLAGFDSNAAIQRGIDQIKAIKDSITYEMLAETAAYLSEVANNFDERYIVPSAENVRKVVDAVRTVNDTADIALIGMFDAYGNSLVYDGQVRDMSYVVSTVFARAAEELTGLDIDVDEEEIAVEELKAKNDVLSKYTAKLRKLSGKVTKYNKAAADKLVSIISEEIAYPMQYMLVGQNIGGAMQSLNQKLDAIAEETGCIYVDVYDISNEHNLDPHPNAQGHHDIADIMKTELSDAILSKMTETAAPEAEKVTLSAKSVTVTAGTTYKLNATVAPYNASQSVKWTSSNTSVATVDAMGVVVAKKAGTAVIMATAENGKKALCTVTVNKKPSVLQTLFRKLLNK